MPLAPNDLTLWLTRTHTRPRFNQLGRALGSPWRCDLRLLVNGPPGSGDDDPCFTQARWPVTDLRGTSDLAPLLRHALASTTTPLMGFLDDDCCFRDMAVGSIEYLVAAFNEHPQAGQAGPLDSGVILWKFKRHAVEVPYGICFRGQGWPHTTWGCQVYRREALDLADLGSLRWWCDSALWWGMERRGWELYHVFVPLSHQMSRGASASAVAVDADRVNHDQQILLRRFPEHALDIERGCVNLLKVRPLAVGRFKQHAVEGARPGEKERRK